MINVTNSFKMMHTSKKRKRYLKDYDIKFIRYEYERCGLMMICMDNKASFLLSLSAAIIGGIILIGGNLLELDTSNILLIYMILISFFLVISVIACLFVLWSRSITKLPDKLKGHLKKRVNYINKIYVDYDFFEDNINTLINSKNDKSKGIKVSIISLLISIILIILATYTMLIINIK